MRLVIRLVVVVLALLLPARALAQGYVPVPRSRSR